MPAKYTLGADPEFFLVDERTQDFVPACGLFGGKKGAPIDLGDGYGVQEDNVMAEINIPPQTTGGQFEQAIIEGRERAIDYIRAKAKNHNLIYMYGNNVAIPNHVMNMPGANQFGCAPDFDAYLKGAAAPAVGPGVMGPWRFAGGHVHFGYDSNIPKFVVAAFADVFLGVPSIRWDTQPRRRRETYGAPGRFRPTDYGIEYRTLSNVWAVEGGGILNKVARNSVSLMRFILERKEAEVQSIFQRMPWRDVRFVIGGQSRGLALELAQYAIDEFGLEIHV